MVEVVKPERLKRRDLRFTNLERSIVPLALIENRELVDNILSVIGNEIET